MFSKYTVDVCVLLRNSMDSILIQFFSIRVFSILFLCFASVALGWRTTPETFTIFSNEK